MYAVERLSSYITRGVYNVAGPFHPFGGAVDIIVVQQEDGSFKSSPWYVRFGKFQGVLKTREKVVNICVNGVDAGFHMYLDHKGEAYFLEECEAGEGEFLASPPSSGDENDIKSRKELLSKIQGCKYVGTGRSDALALAEMSNNAMIVARATSKRARILGLMFGRRSMKENKGIGNVDRVSSLERAEIAADLLDMKWSTNLSTTNCKRERTVNKYCGKDLFNAHEVDKEGCEYTSPYDINREMETMNSLKEEVDDNFGSNILRTEYVEEVAVHSPCCPLDEGENNDGTVRGSFPSSESNEYHRKRMMDNSGLGVSREEHVNIGAHKEVVGMYNMENSALCNKSEPSAPYGTEFGTEGTTVLCSETIPMNSNLHSESVFTDSLSYDAQEAFGKSFGKNEVNSSFSYCESVESMTIKFDASSESRELPQNLISKVGKHIEDIEVLNDKTEYNTEIEPQQISDLQNVTYGEFSTFMNPRIDREVLLQSESNECGDMANIVGYQSSKTHTDEDPYVVKPLQPGYQSNRPSEKVTTPYRCLESSYMAEKTGDSFYESKVMDLDKATNEISIKNEKRIDNLPRNCFQAIEKASESKEACTTISEDTEDDQLQFGEMDGFDAKKAILDLPHVYAASDTDCHFPCNHEGGAKDNDLKYNDCKLSPERFSGVLKTGTSINIPRDDNHCLDIDMSVRSLPNIRSFIHDLERSNVEQPISYSLNSRPKEFEKDAAEKGFTNSLKLEDGSKTIILDHPLMSTRTAMDGSLEQKEAKSIPSVELSLCKHLMYEGMGVNAACQVFDAEKVNFENFSSLGPSVVKNKKLVVKIGGRYFPWDAAAPIVLGMVSFGQEQIFEPQGMIAVERNDRNLNEESGAIVPSQGSWRIWPFGFRRSKTILTERPDPDIDKKKDEDPKLVEDRNRKKFNRKKVLTPTSEQLASLKLKDGQNVVTFSFSTSMLGQQQVDARIYLWKWNARIVISDVDGTITKSDVLGQFMPLVGVDWSQTGVAHLFSAIKDNGFHLLFLSARAISQAYITRQFLFNLKQDGKALPDGPVVISPDGLFPSLYREVIRRAPHEFKISCLEVIRALFPPDCNPFYAGFGNRDTDEISYLKVGVPKGKIFIINPKGEVAMNRRVDTKSYTSLHALVNGMFPAMSSAEQEDFNSWNYWKLPILHVDI